MRLSSAQLSDGSGHAAQDCDVTERSEGEEASSRSGPNSVSTEGRKRGALRPQGAREMSADETKKATRQTQQCRALD